jgi:hypothetical protein
MLFWKRRFPLAIAFLVGISATAQYFIPHPVSERVLTDASVWLRIITGFAMILGLASLFHLHYQKIRRGEAGWGYSLVVLVSMAATAAAGIVPGIIRHGTLVREDNLLTDWFYNYMLVALQGTMFSILAFFLASAAYRAFRARTKEATVLLLAAVLVMCGRVPLGEYLWAPTGLASDWLLSVLNTAAKRGILIGVSLGGIAISLKIIFGIERRYLGGGE